MEKEKRKNEYFFSFFLSPGLLWFSVAWEEEIPTNVLKYAAALVTDSREKDDSLYFSFSRWIVVVETGG